MSDTYYVVRGRIWFGPAPTKAAAETVAGSESGGTFTNQTPPGDASVVPWDKLATGTHALTRHPVRTRDSVKVIDPVTGEVGWRRAFELSPTGLVINGKPTLPQWIRAGRLLKVAHQSILFSIGDWILYGQARPDWGHKYDQAIEVLGMDYDYLCNIVSVCKQVTNPRRHENLSFSHHAEVSHLEPAAQTKLLDQAESQTMSTRELREAVRHETGRTAYQDELDRFEGRLDQAKSWIADMNFKHGWQKRVRIVMYEAQRDQ